MRYQRLMWGCAISCLASVCMQAQADTNYVLTGFAESSGDLRAKGVAWALRKQDTSAFYADFGFSYQQLQLRDTPAAYRRDRISPFFATGRVGIKALVSPYFQVGIDLGQLTKSLFEEDGASCCNINTQLGLTLFAELPVQLDIYGVWYSVKYETGYLQSRYQDDFWHSREEYKRFSPLGVGMRLSVVF